jgi:hypothetical protein
MKRYLVLLLVRVPSIEELINMKLRCGYSDSLNFLEIYAFLQQQLSGLWEVESNGIATKKVLEPEKWTNAGQAVWIDLASIPPLEAAKIRLSCQTVEEIGDVKLKDANVSLGEPIATFDIEQYPKEENLNELEIRVIRLNGKVMLTHVFR